MKRQSHGALMIAQHVGRVYSFVKLEVQVPSADAAEADRAKHSSLHSPPTDLQYIYWWSTFSLHLHITADLRERILPRLYRINSADCSCT